MLVVRVPLAEVRASPDDTAPLVFRAEQNVLLELAEPATSAATTATPGWVKVRHRDGQIGLRPDHAGVRALTRCNRRPSRGFPRRR